MSRLTLELALAASLAAGASAQSNPSFSNFGSGCVDSPGIFYELFPSGTIIDLDGASLTIVPNGSGNYACSPSQVAALPFGAASATAVDIQAADDSVQQRTLTTMTFPYVGANGPGLTADVWIAPNGHVYLEANNAARCCSGTAALTGMLSQSATPAFSIYGCDLNPTSAGTIWFDEQIVGGTRVCVITWDGVTEFGQSLSHTMQMQLLADGRCHMVWIQTDVPSDPILVGWSVGSGQADPGPTDLSTTSVDLGAIPSRPIRISASRAPVEGQPFAVTIQDIRPGAVAAAINLGTVQIDRPLDFVGSPACTAYVLPDIFSSGIAIDSATGTAILDFGTLPNTAGGSAFSVQGVVLDPSSSTTFGILSTDRGDVVIGDDIANSPDVVFKAEGPNSFNSNTATGFFSLRHNDPTRAGLTITKLVVDALPTATNLVFDTDQPGMADRFDGGDRGGTNCLNTYRNGSDTVVGLTYAGTDTSSCDPGATGTGYIARNPIIVANSAQTLEFNFTDFQFGETFEFDADTDGGPGIGGDDMAGIVITVTFSDGSMASGAIIAIQSDSGAVIL